jgi:hypothetical protein
MEGTTYRRIFISTPQQVIIFRVIKFRRMRWAGYVARVGEDRDVYRALVERSDGSGLLGRPRRREEDDNGRAVQEVEWRNIDWIDVTQETGQVAGSCECGDESIGVHKMRESS